MLRLKKNSKQKVLLYSSIVVIVSFIALFALLQHRDSQRSRSKTNTEQTQPNGSPITSQTTDELPSATPSLISKPSVQRQAATVAGSPQQAAPTKTVTAAWKNSSEGTNSAGERYVIKSNCNYTFDDGSEYKPSDMTTDGDSNCYKVGDQVPVNFGQ